MKLPTGTRQPDDKQRLNEQNILLRVSQAIISTMDYEEVLQIITDGVAELLGIETAAIYMVENRKEIFLGATTPPLDPGMPDELRRAAIQDHPHIRTAIEKKHLLVIEDFSNAKLSEAEKKVRDLRNLKSIIYFPIIQKEDVLGVLIMGTQTSTREFSDYELHLGQNVANQLSIGIQNARLHNDLSEKNRQLEEEISERKKIAEALKTSETHLSNALRIAGIGHWEYDVKKDLFIFTDEFYEIFHTTAEKVGGYKMSSERYAEQFVHPEDRQMVSQEIRKALESKDPDFSNAIEHRFLYADRAIGYMIVRSRINKNEAGDTVRIFGANQDITATKVSEKMLLRAVDKAEESDRLKSAFLANLSHEIRTPMNAILGFSGLLKEKDLTEAERENYLDHIQSGGQRLLRIISDIVDISKFDANILKLTSERINLNKLLDDLVRQFSLRLPGEQVELRAVKPLPDEESFIFTDYTRLSQIFSNLLENAIKFTRKGVIKVGYKMDDGDPVLFVMDTGIGINKKNHELIFERFRKLETGQEMINTGTGLGLSIVRSIIDLMEGEIKLESEPGNGTAFYIRIPGLADRSDEKPVAMKSVKRIAGKDLTILVAEDEVTNYLYLEALFMKHEFRIIHAKNGREAVEKFRKHPDVDLVLMDIKMPVMNGIDATREIRDIDPAVPIIAQSAYAMAEDKREALDAGCNDYLTKPITIERISDSLNKFTV